VGITMSDEGREWHNRFSPEQNIRRVPAITRAWKIFTLFKPRLHYLFVQVSFPGFVPYINLFSS
jgi:hypothetical protein